MTSRSKDREPQPMTNQTAASPRIFAGIDIGTLTCRLLIAELTSAGELRELQSDRRILRLGQGVDRDRVLRPDAMARVVATLKEWRQVIDDYHVDAATAVATSAVRDAGNRDEFLGLVQREAGLQVEVISGEEEGRLAYLGARSGLGAFAGSLVAFDTGGGSSQFTFGHDTAVDERFSVEVGAVKYTERFHLDQVTPIETLANALQAIAADLSRLDNRPVPEQLVAMGGVVTNITAVKHRLATYDPTVVQGTVLDRAEIDRQIELYRTQDSAARRSIVGLQAKREEVILAGACIVRTVMQKLGKQSFTVSDRGLRHGLLAERFGT